MAELSFDPNQLNEKENDIYQEMIKKRKNQGAPFDGPYLALMNHPELCQKIEALGYYLKFQGHLPREIYQFVVLAVAKYTQSTFEWEDHFPHALEAGVPKGIISLLETEGLAETHFTEPYRLIVQVLQATLQWKNIPEDVQAQVIQIYGIKAFIEITVLSGFYQMFSAINQGFDISKK